jgi:hypothetical protein
MKIYSIMAALAGELRAILQPTYHQCIDMWMALGLSEHSCMPQSEKEWLDDKEYILENYKNAISKLNIVV